MNKKQNLKRKKLLNARENMGLYVFKYHAQRSHACRNLRTRTPTMARMAGHPETERDKLPDGMENGCGNVLPIGEKKQTNGGNAAIYKQ